jgi:simple sugar transport system permease protein
MILKTIVISGALAGLAATGFLLTEFTKYNETFPLGLPFTGIAVALLGRNHPIGIVLAALLFAGLDSGARQLSGEIPAELARALATIIQGAVILFVGGEGLLHWIFRARGKNRERSVHPPTPTPRAGESI